MFCYSCGTNIPDDATSCSNCGKPVTSAPSFPSGSQTSTGAAVAPAPQQNVPMSPWLNVPPLASYTGTQQPYFGPQETDGKAVGSLVLGILGIFPLSIFAAIPAVVLGHLAKSSIRQSMGRLKGAGMATAGLIMGYIVVAFIPVFLIIAAIAIPNLLRARQSANEAAAASTVRTLNTAQVTYSVNYPARGYARDLSTLGPGNVKGCADPSETHACLIDGRLGPPECTAGRWCHPRNGFVYSISAVCAEGGACSEYVIFASPVNDSTGTRSFCSTSDAIVRAHSGRVGVMLTADDCKSWSPL